VRADNRSESRHCGRRPRSGGFSFSG
jgi:hypothetical protein